MNIRTTLIVISAVVGAYPALANGPMPGDSQAPNNNGSSQMSPERERWVRNRMKHLRDEMHEQQKADTIAREMDRLQAATNNNYGRFMFPEGASPAAQHQYMINRYEFLALKAERGKATPKERAEMRALQHRLVGSH